MISVSIVTYNTENGELESCLNSLDSPLIDIIYIIDNSRRKETEQFCRQYDKVKYIGSENVGYGAGHNKALNEVLNDGGKYHLVLNSDVYFEPDVLEKIVKYMDANPQIGQLHPRMEYPDGRLQYSCRLLPNPLNLFGRRFLPDLIMRKIDCRYTLAFDDHKKSFNVPYHQGSFMFFRINALRKIGLFDERYFMYPEDIDITRRMHREYDTIFYPEVIVVHAHRQDSYKNRRMLKIHIVNMIKYFNKWGWFFDKERREFNRRLLDTLNYKK